jgi:c(7)-type cytochrome triheme protein
MVEVTRNARVCESMKRKTHICIFVLICLVPLICVPVMGAEPSTVPGDIQYERIESGEGDMSAFAPAIFPHWIHRINYRCDACHDSLFKMKLGATPVTMDLMKEGKVCGACHDGKLAFSSGFENCNRCHVAAKD